MRKIRAAYIFLIALFLTTAVAGQDNVQSQAQSFVVSGRIVDGGNGKAPLEFASAYIISKNADSAPPVRIGADSDSTGHFTFNAPAGKYTFEVYLIGYKKNTADIEINGDLDLGTVSLKPLSNELRKAVVSESMIDYNSSGYKMNIRRNQFFQQMTLPEALMTAPGVLITSTTKTVYGKQIETIYVDNREINYSQDMLINFLNSISTKNVKDIEVVTEPGVNPDGVTIRINTSKVEGGTLILGGRIMGNQSKFLYSPNANFMYRRGKFSAYADAMYMRMSLSDSSRITEIRDGDIVSTDYMSRDGDIKRSLQGTVGIGYDISPKDYISAEVSDRNLSREDITKYRSGSEIEQNTLYNVFNASGQYIHTFSEKSKLTFRNYFTASHKDITYNGSQESDLKTFSTRLDYNNSFLKKDSFMAGVGYSTLTRDYSGSDYDEDIGYAYASYSYDIKSFSIRGGVRGETKTINGYTFSSLVPDLSVSYYMNRKKGSLMRLSYGRSVTMPTLSQLTPTLEYSPKYINVGNPDLRPSISNQFGYSVTLFRNHTVSASYSWSDDSITSYSYEEDGQIYLKPVNAASSYGVGVRYNASIQPFNWWNISGDIDYYYSERTANEIENKSHYLSYHLISMMMLPKSINISADMFGGIHNYTGVNFKESNPVMIGVNASKSLKKGKYRIALRINDLLNSNKRKVSETILESYTKRTKLINSSRSYQISFSYNFSWGKRQRINKIQASDMSKRIQ